MADNVYFDSSKKTGTVTLSNNNLTAKLDSNNAFDSVNIGRTTGKYYWEIKIDSKATSATSLIGIIENTSFISITSSNIRAYMGYTSPQKKPESTTYGSNFSTGDIASVLLNIDDGTLEFWKNGVSQGISHTNIKLLTTPIFAAVFHASSGNPTTVTANFGATPFTYKMPLDYHSYDLSQSTVEKFLISTNQKNYSVKKLVDKNVSIISPMSSDSTSTQITTADAYSSGRNPYLAFDGVTTTSWSTNSMTIPTGGHWLQIKFSEKKCINKISLTSYEVSTGYPSIKDFTIYGSNDGIQFDSLFTGTQQNNTTKQTYSFSNKVLYGTYRITIPSSYHSSYAVGISEMEMFEDDKFMLKTIDSASESLFTKYGMNKNDEVNMASPISSTVFISIQSSDLGSGKVFKQNIDTSKRPIKSISIT
jgi:SPRY domain./F5/8 type C domain.